MRDSVGIQVLLFKGNVVALNYTYYVLRQPRRMVFNLFEALYSVESAVAEHSLLPTIPHIPLVTFPVCLDAGRNVC